jgi:putative transposase
VFVYEFKVNPKPSQILAIDEAIRTAQFVRNKVLSYWMDNRGVGKTEMFRYNTQLRKEYKFVEDLNSHACQTAVERVLKAVNRFYDNCQKQKPGKKGSLSSCDVDKLSVKEWRAISPSGFCPTIPT